MCRETEEKATNLKLMRETNINNIQKPGQHFKDFMFYAFFTKQCLDLHAAKYLLVIKPETGFILFQ